jgi:hypothetical protein
MDLPYKLARSAGAWRPISLLDTSKMKTKSAPIYELESHDCSRYTNHHLHMTDEMMENRIPFLKQNGKLGALIKTKASRIGNHMEGDEIRV